ncbi:MAG: DNA-formamidopyrimidine glycosylase family protein [Myxococcota bacterium]
MPELPDVEVYIERLGAMFAGKTLTKVRIGSPFLVRSVGVPPQAAEGAVVTGFQRLGKRIVFRFDNDVRMVLHLMVAGRLKLGKPGQGIPGKIGLAAWDFAGAPGALILTEASPKKRASLHIVRGDDAVMAFDPGGIEPLTATFAAFKAALTRENHTLKRSLTDPHVFSGIGNAYSDEILWRAQLSPVTWTTRLSDADLRKLYDATRLELVTWTERLRAEAGQGFPEKVTAFRDDMAVHGKYGQPCPRCAQKVMRIRYADNETNYCPTCQTGGKLLADRGLSRLLKGDWPKTLEELEARMRGEAKG